jgi:hypothetical protein
MKNTFLLLILILTGCSKGFNDQTVITQQKQTIQTATATVLMHNKRIAIDCDGNYHDRDDICAISVEIALIAKAGLQSKLTYLGYSDHYWKSTTSQQTQEKTSVMSTADAWGGFDKSKFIEVRTYHSTAVTMLKNEINKSTATDSLIIAALGPMQVVGEALGASNSTARKYVRVVSHSTWNNEHAARYGSGEGLSGTKYNLESGYSCKPITSMGVKITKIKDQNATVSASYYSYYWLRDATDNKLNVMWRQGQVAAKSNFDCSDAGVIWYILFGDQDGSPSKLQAFFK